MDFCETSLVSGDLRLLLLENKRNRGQEVSTLTIVRKKDE